MHPSLSIYSIDFILAHAFVQFETYFKAHNLPSTRYFTTRCPKLARVDMREMREILEFTIFQRQKEQEYKSTQDTWDSHIFRS